MGPIQNIAELINFLTRRMNVIALALGLGLVWGLYTALNTVPTYQAITTLGARVDVVTNDQTRPDRDNTPARLLQLVEQRLTTRDNMLDLANRYNMFPGLTVDERVNAMRQAITLVSQSAVLVGVVSDGNLASITIMAQADDSGKAADIANELAAMVLDQTDQGRRARARETLEFLRAEQNNAQQELVALEAEIRRFTDENYEFMPFNAETRRSEMSQIDAAISEAQREISSAEAELGRAQTPTPRRQGQLRETITQARVELARLEQRRRDLEPFFLRVTQTERALATYGANEERLNARISDLSFQVAQGEGALRLEAQERGAAFEVLEIATPPQYPISRSRKTVLLMGVVGSAIVGLLAAFALDMLRPALRSPGQLQRECGMRPIIILPELTLPSEQRRTRIAWAAGLCLLVLTLLALLLTFRGG